VSNSGALEAALRALRHRDLSVADLEQRLAGRGFDERERAEALATLSRTGVLDDRRFAESRARALAERGAGDVLIRYDLEKSGVSSELIEDAVCSLQQEPERARRVVERRGVGPRTIRYLSGKGFSDETVAAVVATGSHDELG
jgi:regulatory protein